MLSLNDVPLIASILTTVGPVMQVVHIIRTKSVEGLSVATCVLLTIGAALGVLLGIQYELGLVVFFMGLSLFAQALMFCFVSWKLGLSVCAVIVALPFLVNLLMPDFAADMLTTSYTQIVAFIWGLIAANSFIPQVLATRKTRQTQDLSLINVLCFTVGLSLWTVFAWSVQNWTLLLWCTIITASLYELLRLKLTVTPASVN